MLTKTLFMMEDRILGQVGLYAMWTTLYLSNLIILFCDNTTGPSRDFNIITNGLSVLYISVSNLNIIYGNGLPSTMMMATGPIHQYLFWLLFAYYGGSDVLGSHPIGVYNWITLFVVGMFTLDMFVKTWVITLDNGKKYVEYVVETSSRPTEDAPLEEVSVEESYQKVAAKFNFKEGKLQEFKQMLDDPETGISLTKSSEGYIDIDILNDEDDKDVLILIQKWKTKQNHVDYIQKRKDMGMFDHLVEMLKEPPEIRYLSNN